MTKLYSSTDYTEDFGKEDIKKNKFWSLISYIPFLFIITLLVRKDSKAARFHAGQGLTLFIFEAAGLIVYCILRFIFEFFALTSAFIFLNFIMSVLIILAFTLILSGVMNSSGGLCKTLPFIGGIVFIK